MLDTGNATNETLPEMILEHWVNVLQRQGHLLSACASVLYCCLVAKSFLTLLLPHGLEPFSQCCESSIIPQGPYLSLFLILAVLSVGKRIFFKKKLNSPCSLEAMAHCFFNFTIYLGDTNPHPT